MNFKKQIGSKLKKNRVKAKFTQQQIADKVGISSKYLDRIEKGEASPSMSIIYNIAEVLDVSTSDKCYTISI